MQDMFPSPNWDDFSKLEREALQHEASGNAVSGIQTAFPKNPPPNGIAYSKNFARFQKDGPMAVQTRD